MTSVTPLETCLVLVTRTSDGADEVLLGRKLRGFGRSRVVAPGGKIDAGESAQEAATRELEEETGLRAQTLVPAGVLDFRFSQDALTQDMRAHVFIASDALGAVQDSDEIAGRWVRQDEIPYIEMWPDARHWMPRALAGTLRRALFVYGADGVTLERFEL